MFTLSDGIIFDFGLCVWNLLALLKNTNFHFSPNFLHNSRAGSPIHTLIPLVLSSLGSCCVSLVTTFRERIWKGKISVFRLIFAHFTLHRFPISSWAPLVYAPSPHFRCCALNASTVQPRRFCEMSFDEEKKNHKQWRTDFCVKFQHTNKRTQSINPSRFKIYERAILGF